MTIAPYNQFEWEATFKNSNIYKQLDKDFDVISFDKEWLEFQNISSKITPRQWAADRTIPTYFSALPFYYIEWLQEINPEKIYDLGCGWNIFKKYYSNIIGIDKEDSVWSSIFDADVSDIVDEHYIANHQEYFESVFSICALHFIPLSDIRKCVLDFHSIIKPNGRGWLSLNAARLLQFDSKFQNADLLTIQNYIEKQLSDIPNLVMLDVFSLDTDCCFDGNIHIIFDKNN